MIFEAGRDLPRERGGLENLGGIPRLARARRTSGQASGHGGGAGAEQGLAACGLRACLLPWVPFFPLQGSPLLSQKQTRTLPSFLISSLTSHPQDPAKQSSKTCKAWHLQSEDSFDFFFFFLLDFLAVLPFLRSHFLIFKMGKNTVFHRFF